MIVYKLPTGINLEAVRALKGTEGTFLNPVEDADGNWIISAEEVHSPEFDEFKIKYVELIMQFQAIDFNPKINVKPW